ncbi:bacteriohemerythrin [Motiliproteus sediminis]|uniref:bacteriohemerythrin n=1 Tax=Motiliproteus sediminis TaxID=1468178 RepID=UPI001AF00B8F
MSRYLWRDEYAMGDAEVDAQHRKLFALLDQLYEAVCVGEGQDAVGGVLEELLAYTREHFHQEEVVMREIQYPGLEQHQREHEKLMAEVRHQLETFRRGERIVSIELLEFMNNWLGNHILKSDRLVSDFISGRG